MGRHGTVLLVAAAVTGAAVATPAAATGAPHAAVVSADPADWTPHVTDGEVLALLAVGNRVVAGGSFTAVREATAEAPLRRHNVFAFDARTGAVDRAFAPEIDGRVEALAAAPDGDAIFVGGDLTGPGGSRHLVKLDLATGAAVAGFHPGVAGGSVQDLAVGDGRLLLGGAFSAVGSVPRAGLAAVDPITGAVDPAVDVPFTEPRAGRPRVEKFDVSDDGTRLVAVGNFTRAAGQEHHQIAVVDLAASPARLADWHTDRYEDDCSSAWHTYMRDVDISPDGSYFVAVTAGARAHPTLCDTAARWELSDRGRDLQPSWVDYSGGDSFTGVAVTGAVVYVGGHQRWMNNPFPRGTGSDARPGPGAVPRSGIAALDPVNGLPLSWNPGRTMRGAGAAALLATPTGLWIGSDTDDFGGEHHGRIAFCPLAGGSPAPKATPARLPADLYAVGPGGEITRRPFDGSSAGPATPVATDRSWSGVRGIFMVGGTVYSGWADGRVEARPFDGTTFGAPRTLDLHGLRHSDFPVADVTGMFFADGRLYYSVDDRRRLYYRYFTPESGVVGAEELVASGDTDGLDWSDVTGLAFASGRIYYADGDGALRHIDFAGGRPVPGTDGVVAGGGQGDPGGWTSAEMFVFSP